MLDLLPKAFVFDNVRLKDGVWTMDFHPNPEYSPHGIEERVLSAMSGTVVIDAAEERLMHVEGQLPQDVSIGVWAAGDGEGGKPVQQRARGCGGAIGGRCMC